MAVFQFNRIVGKRRRILLFGEHSGRTNHMDTMKYATFLYDTVEVENGHACDGAERNIKS